MATIPKCQMQTARNTDNMNYIDNNVNYGDNDMNYKDKKMN